MQRGTKVMNYDTPARNISDFCHANQIQAWCSVQIQAGQEHILINLGSPHVQYAELAQWLHQQGIVQSLLMSLPVVFETTSDMHMFLAAWGNVYERY